MAEAVYCWLTPIGSVRSSGEIEMAVIDGAVTLTRVELDTLPRVAVMVVLPAATPPTKPAAVTVAFAMVEEDQVTRAVRSRLLPSL